MVSGCGNRLLLIRSSHIHILLTFPIKTTTFLLCFKSDIFTSFYYSSYWLTILIIRTRMMTLQIHLQTHVNNKSYKCCHAEYFECMTASNGIEKITGY